MKAPLLLPALVVLGLSPCLGGCGAGAATERAPSRGAPAAPPAPLAAAPASQPAPAPPGAARSASSPTVVTYVEIDRAWVEAHTQAPSDRVKAWAADPAHLASAVPMTRHILVKSFADAPPAERAAARKKALAALARITRGEDFAKVAREVSDDPGSKDKGGAYPGEMVEHFVEPYRAAYAALAPGKVTKELVETQFGFHVIKKDAVDDAALAAGYRRATSMQTTRRIADALVERLKPERSEASVKRIVNEVVTAELGSAAAREESGPSVHLVPVAQVLARPATPPREETCAKIIAVPPGAVTVMSLDEARGVLVVKAGTEAAVDPSVRAVTKGDMDEDVFGYCRSRASTMSADDIRRLIEKTQRAEEKK